MAVMLENSDLIDPLHDYSGPSLFPLTFEGLNRSANYTHGGLQFSFDALALKSPSNLSEQANTVLKRTSEHQNSEFLRGMSSEYNDRDLHPKANVRPQERRPALGRKRARFSLKPTTRHSSLGGGMSLNTNQLQDPEEYFLAFENLERAEKEIKKQMGESSMDPIQQNTSIVARSRSRRPGILGRKSGHKHRFASVAANLDETLGPSQKLISAADISSPSNSMLNRMSGDTHGASQEKELADSAAEEKNKADDLFDELLSEDCTDLDGDGAFKFMQKRLQIGPINVEKLCLPEVDSVRKSDNNVSLVQLPRPIKVLSDIQNLTKRARTKGPVEIQQLASSSIYSTNSPSPPKNPFSSAPMLSRHMSGADKPGDPFLFPAIDNISPAGDSIQVESSNKKALSPDFNSKLAEINENGPNLSDQTRAKEMSLTPRSIVTDKLVSGDSTLSLNPMDGSSSDLMNLSLNECDGGFEDKVEDMNRPELLGREKNLADSDMVLKSGAIDDSAHPLEPVDDNSTNSSNHMNLSGNGCDDGLEDNLEDLQKPKALGEEKNLADSNVVLDKLVTVDAAQSPDPMVSNLREFRNHMDNSINGSDDVMEDKFEDMQQLEAIGSKQVELSYTGLTTENLHFSGSQLDISSPTVDKDHPRDGRSDNLVLLPEQNDEVHQESSIESLSVQRRDRAPLRNGRKKIVSHRKSLAGASMNVQGRQKKPTHSTREAREVSRRQSLIGAGTQWQSGVRRSTRIRMRPLEYWRGEQFIYGRVHESLLTVIGCKCASPTAGAEKPKLKVLPFVSNGHENLIKKPWFSVT